MSDVHIDNMKDITPNTKPASPVMGSSSNKNATPFDPQSAFKWKSIFSPLSACRLCIVTVGARNIGAIKGEAVSDRNHFGTWNPSCSGASLFWVTLLGRKTGWVFDFWRRNLNTASLYHTSASLEAEGGLAQNEKTLHFADIFSLNCIDTKRCL